MLSRSLMGKVLGALSSHHFSHFQTAFPNNTKVGFTLLPGSSGR